MRSNLGVVSLLSKVVFHVFVIASFEVENYVCSEQNVHFLMSNSKFAIRSTIRRQGNDNHSFVTVTLKERYSLEQKRARITYQVDGGVKSDLIYEAATGASIDYKEALESCKGSSLDELFHQLYQSDSTIMFDLMTTQSEHNHVVGPAKLLSIVCSEANDLVQNYWPAGERQMRNLPTIEFLLRTKTNRGRSDVQMLIYYDHETFSLDKICQLVPLRIWIKFPDKGHSIVVDYFEFKMEVDGDEANFNSGTSLNEFTFPVGLDCPESPTNQSKVDLFGENKLKRFSFEASVSWLMNVPINYFVAYDKSLGVMKINMLDNEEEDLTQILLDFNANRTFTCFGHLKNCFTTETNQVSALHPLSRLLLGSDESLLSYMGLALVRNIKAHVYEVYLGETLPLWFIQPTLVKYGQDYKLRQPEKLLVGSSTGSHVLTLYIAANKLPQDLQILQLDIHDLNKQPSLACIVRAQIYNFHNDLMSKALFSLPLDFKENSGTKFELLLGGGNELKLNLKRDYEWLNNRATRDDAILTSLSRSLELPTVFIHDLKSRLDEFTVSLSFRVAIPSQQKLYTFSYLGKFELNKEVDLDNFVQIKSSTLSGCLAILSKCPTNSHSPVFLFYSERTKRCLMNEKLINKVKSGCNVDLRSLDQAFKLDEKSFGEMYMIEWQLDLVYENSILKANNFHHLEKRSLALRHSGVGEFEELYLDIKRAKLDKNWQLDGGRGESFTLAGFGLPVQAGVEEADVKVESLQQCEAACLRDIDCQLYSYCVRGNQVQCMLSNVNISDEADKPKEDVKIGEQVILPLNESENYKTQLKVERDPRCQLNQKLFLDLFVQRPHKNVYVTQHEVVPVASKEACAKLCFFRSLKVLHDELSSSNFCQSFKFLDNRMLNELQDQTLKLLMDGKLSGHLWCLLEREVEMDLHQQMSKYNADFVRRTLFMPESFEFDYTALYEQTYGFSLVNSDKTFEESKAFYFVNLDKAKASPKDYELLQGELAKDSSKNYQLRSMDGLKDCAKKCFTQTGGLWPACKSFDFIHDNNQLQSRRQDYSCHLNTLSINSIEFGDREQLISRCEQGENVHKWHYEPRFHTFNYSEPLSFEQPDDNFRSHWLLLGLVTITSIVCGFLLASQLDRQLKIRLLDKLDCQPMDIQLTQH